MTNKLFCSVVLGLAVGDNIGVRFILIFTRESCSCRKFDKTQLLELTNNFIFDKQEIF